jgi:hypothetical protein
MTEDRRTELLELRVAERELVAQIEKATATLQANRARQARLKALLVSSAKTSIGLQSVSTEGAARAAIAKMGTFTRSEAMAELGWPQAKTTRFLKKLIGGQILEPKGKIGGEPRYHYTGPQVEYDPEAERKAAREAAALVAVRDWALSHKLPFTPSQAAAGADVPRPTALRQLRALQAAGVLDDQGPTEDMPLFVVAGSEPVALPEAKPVEVHRVTSKIPATQELLDAAYAANCDVAGGNGHIAITSLDGDRVIIAATPQGRERLLADKAKLRRIGVDV